jgi:hypothetical protein
MNGRLLDNQYIFLLGGRDLEMLEIKKILASEKLTFFDYALEWGAKLSSYVSLFNDSNTFIGIELTQDIDPPRHYIEIDHHNKDSHKSSSLEQIIELLKNDLRIEIELSGDLQLIAVNDKGYIPAMLKMGATPREVEDIRRRDRKAQGVTEEDELLAEESIQKHRTIENGITIIKSSTSRFSTITDRLFPCNKLLIYTDNELTYYGKGVSFLVLAFAGIIKQQKAYSGGGENGFFGIGSNTLETNKLMKVKNEIITILTKKNR